METLVASLNTVLYMLLVMVLGRWVVGRLPERDTVVAQLNRLVFSMFLPFMVFQNIYTTDIKSAFDGRLLVYLLTVLCAMWLLLMVLAPKWVQDRPTCGTFIQCAIRSNSIILGIPLISGLCAGQELGCPTLVAAVTTIFFNVIGVITLEVYRGKAPDLRQIGKNLVKNPVLTASIAALFLALLELRLPASVEKAVGTMAGMASPMGLLLIGASLRLGVGQRTGALLGCLLLRLAVIPAIGVSGAVLLGWRGMELCTGLMVLATPTSVSAYSMAQMMGGNGTFAANQVGLSSVLGAVTVFFWILALGGLQLL